MAASFQFRLITPTGVVFEGTVEEVSAIGPLGEFGVLADHINFITSLVPGVLEARLAEGRAMHWVVSGRARRGEGRRADDPRERRGNAGERGRRRGGRGSAIGGQQVFESKFLRSRLRASPGSLAARTRPRRSSRDEARIALVFVSLNLIRRTRSVLLSCLGQQSIHLAVDLFCRLQNPSQRPIHSRRVVHLAVALGSFVFIHESLGTMQ